MKTNLIITIPVSTEGVIQNYNAASSIEKKFNCLKPILSELFGCAGIDISANVHYVQPKDERVVRESHKPIKGTLFQDGYPKGPIDFKEPPQRCFKEPIEIKIIKKPIRIIRQENSKIINSVNDKKHARRPGMDNDAVYKTFCGVKYEDRDGWIDYIEDVELEKAQEAVSCMMCMKGLRSYIKKVKK